MFIVLFVYVFGGAISTPGYDYVDFLMPGIITQSIAFGGFVTAIGLNEDLRKGLIDRFRSLPMTRSAVLAGRTIADIVLNTFSLVVMLSVGFLVGFNFDSPAYEIVAGILLLLAFGYAFSWFFALMGMIASSPESAQSVGFLVIFPLTFASSAFVPTDIDADVAAEVRRRQPVHDRRQRGARAVARRPGRQLRLGRGGVDARDDRASSPRSPSARTGAPRSAPSPIAAAPAEDPPPQRPRKHARRPTPPASPPRPARAAARGSRRAARAAYSNRSSSAAASISSSSSTIVDSISCGVMSTVLLARGDGPWSAPWSRTSGTP